MEIPPSETALVLIGNCGVGKSTLVEKCTNAKGLSSDASESFTKSATVFPIHSEPRRSVYIADTPGANSTEDTLEHNLWIAQAFNWKPVGLIMVVVTAETRIDNTISAAREYFERFIEWSDYLCPVVTMMDTVKWSEDEFRKKLKQVFGLTRVVFSQKATTVNQLKNQILPLINASPLQVDVNSRNFLKYFKIHDSNFRILKVSRNEVTRYESIYRRFQEILDQGSWKESDKIDLVFEFQAFMAREIEEARKRLIDDCKFTFTGADELNQYGHVASMVNQMKNVLLNVRRMTLGFQASHGATDLRKCPHCGLIWAKIVGCPNTICGNRVGMADTRHTTFATFDIKYDKDLIITKTREWQFSNRVNTNGIGCGNPIVWDSMAPVQVPLEFQVAATVHTDDVGELQTRQQLSWENMYQQAVRGLGSVKVM